MLALVDGDRGLLASALLLVPDPAELAVHRVVLVAARLVKAHELRDQHPLRRHGLLQALRPLLQHRVAATSARARVGLLGVEYYDLGVRPCGTRLGIRKGRKGTAQGSRTGTMENLQIAR